MKYLIIVLLAVFGLTSCHYVPFVKYRLSHGGKFRHFSKWEKFVGNNNSEFRKYDVKKYDIDLKLFPDDKKMEGDVFVNMEITESTNSIMLDFHSVFKIDDLSIQGKSFKIKRKKNIVFFHFDAPLKAKEVLGIRFKYSGKPKNVIGEGPIQWKKDKQDRYHISSSTEGIGPHFMFPCNQLLQDEADTVNIIISVPDDLIVTANGPLISQSKADGYATFHHRVTNPINIYNISFNAGHFTKLIKPYTDINGENHDLEFMVLDYNKEKADSFYDQTGDILKFFEERFGVYPWWNDGLRFVESTFSAMEHQSAIAMGSYYSFDWRQTNTTLVHEIAHEWWGNKMTGFDYCDMWIHEGFATYAENLFIEHKYGKSDYDKMMWYRMEYFVKNKIPVRKKCGVVYNSWAADKDQNIYSKGACMLHSIRTLINNDEKFMRILRNLQDEGVQTLSSDEFISKFNHYAGKDYSKVFYSYLDDVQPPILKVEIKESDIEKTLTFSWKKAPEFDNLGIHLEIKNKEEFVLNPTLEEKSLTLNINDSLQWNRFKSFYFIVED